jgi:HD domain
VSTECPGGGMVIVMSALHDTIAGIPIPDSTIAREATEFVQDVSTPLLFHHSRRVFLWGSLYGEELLLDYDRELFYVAAVFHDLGLVEGHRSEHERFEIDGANAAREFLERHGLPQEQVTLVWDAIALHTTPEIPRYKRPEVRLVNWGVEYDIPGRHFEELTAEQREAVIAAHPRRGFKDGVIEALSDVLRDKPETAYAGWQIDLLEATMPGYVQANFCDVVRRSRFAT